MKNGLCDIIYGVEWPDDATIGLEQQKSPY